MTIISAVAAYFDRIGMTEPEPLLASVQKHLKVVTNEKNTWRLQSSDGKCIESDDIFELPEQD